MEHITTDIGCRIREAREQRGLTIPDIANRTKIASGLLLAIEHDDFARLPGGIYNRAYLRAFAIEVGLDGEALTREYRARFEAEIAGAGSVQARETGWHDRVPLRGGLPAVLVAIGILIGWMILSRTEFPRGVPHERSTAAPVDAAVPNQTAPTAGRETADDAAPPNAPVSETSLRSLAPEMRVAETCSGRLAPWVSAARCGRVG